MSVEFKAEAVCGECGRAGAYEFSTGLLCLDCYEGHGSCCPEFGENEACEPEEHSIEE